jgi:hypothetical protein
MVPSVRDAGYAVESTSWTAQRHILVCTSAKRAVELSRSPMAPSSKGVACLYTSGRYLTQGGATPIRPHHLAPILDVSFQTANTLVQKLGITDPCLKNTTVRALATDLQALPL